MQVRAQAHAGEEHRGEEDIGGHGHLFGDELAALAQVAEDEAGEIGAGDVGHAEHVLGAPGHEEAKGQGPHGQAAAVGVVAGDPAEEADHQQAHHQGEHEEEDDEQNGPQHAAGAAGADGVDDGEDDDAHHVVDEGRAQDGRAYLGVEAAHLGQGLHRDADRGGGEDRAHVQAPHHAGEIESFMVEQQIGPAAEDEGHHHAQHGDEQGLHARAPQLLHVRIQARQKHQHQHADLGGLHDEIRGLHHVEAAGAQDDAGQQRAHHLGLVGLFRQQAQGFGGQQDDGQPEDISVIHIITYP